MTQHSRLMVYVRVKPLHIEETRSVIDVVDDKTLVFDPKDVENEPNHEYYYHGKKFKSIGSKQKKNYPYSFDYVFDTKSSNYQIYQVVTKPMVQATIEGVNCSVFAYGATGSGKTFTMIGSKNCPGVIYHTSKDLYGKLKIINETDPLPPELKVCYFEIYNEKIRDLLIFETNYSLKCNGKRQKLGPKDACNLPICDANNDGASVIPALSYHTPTNAEQLIELLEIGNAHRSQHPTEANADSSRSHAIFQIVLTRRTRCIKQSCDGPEYELQSSKMSLIDLAGSERASVAYRAGADRSKNLQREGGNINKSLLALGNCINALADSKHSQKHVPYRNSKLTRLLRDSLGGRCKTAMIATVCQQPTHYDDTQNTLMYASRAKCIKLKPGRNFTGVQVAPRNYNIIIENQNRQLATLQARIQELETECQKHEENNKNTPHPQPLHQHILFDTLRDKIPPQIRQSVHYNKLCELIRTKEKYLLELVDCKAALKKAELRIKIKEVDDLQKPKEENNLNSTFNVVNPVMKNSERQRHCDTIVRGLNDIDKSIVVIVGRMSSEFVVNSWGTEEQFDILLNFFLSEQNYILEKMTLERCEQLEHEISVDYLNKYIEIKSNMTFLAEEIEQVFVIIRGRGFSNQFEERFERMLKTAAGKRKNVKWNDQQEDILEMEPLRQKVLRGLESSNNNQQTL